MAHNDVTRIAVLDQITIAAIARAAGRGLFTAAEAELLIDRLHAHTTTPPSSVQDSPPTAGGGHAGSLPISPDGTVR